MGLGSSFRRRRPHRYISITPAFAWNFTPMYIGARLGISEHVDDNRMAFGFHLTKQDHAAIEEVLSRSQGRDMIATIGDCGAEYRS